MGWVMWKLTGSSELNNLLFSNNDCSHSYNDNALLLYSTLAAIHCKFVYKGARNKVLPWKRKFNLPNRRKLSKELLTGSFLIIAIL